MVLYYALGGGLGHLTRARRVLTALGSSDEATLLTASRYAGDPRVTGGLPVVDVPRRLGYDRVAFRRWLAGTLRELAPDELIVDSFPGGILGELCGCDLPPARLLARRLRWPAYRRRLPGPLPRYEVAHVIEPLSGLYRDALASIAPRPEPLSLAPAARGPLDDTRLDDEPHIAVVHSGPDDELGELIDLAHELRRGARTRVVVVSPHRPTAAARWRHVDPSARWRDVYPVAPHLHHAELIVTAAGWGAMQDTEHVRDRHRFVPFPRALDDQFARARAAEAARRAVGTGTAAATL